MTDRERELEAQVVGLEVSREALRRRIDTLTAALQEQILQTQLAEAETLEVTPEEWAEAQQNAQSMVSMAMLEILNAVLAKRKVGGR